MLERATRRNGSLWDKIGDQASAEQDLIHQNRANERKKQAIETNKKHIEDMAVHKLKKFNDQKQVNHTLREINKDVKEYQWQ